MIRDDEIFGDALDLPVSERAVFLKRACAGDDTLRARVEAMLVLHAESEVPRFLEVPLAPRGAVLPEEKPGDRIGRYKLIQKIGEGGCGVVYMAEQEEPVRRRVALKVIKLGMDTKAVVARFEIERQALAMMDHSNIAKVLDAGATEAGRPFFVMELVRGIPITRYCDENQLTPTRRVELFITVCQAIQHAHQKGIIHRDIKPSNILLTVNEGAPTPKVIDFGIAKATQGRLTDHTLVTAFEQFIGTPAYMSPEQADLSGLDVDTRSDIYSLGVLLYELLTGQPPFDPKSFLQIGVGEIRHRIREIEPPKPSTRLRTLTDADQATSAKHRGTVPAQLSLLLRGDLDWIVMRCLEKDRTRRYDTANALAVDLQHHLRHEPVVARPPSTGYLLGKLARRHRFGFAVAAVIALIVVAGAALTTWQAIRARRAEHLAMHGEQEQRRLRTNESLLRGRAEAAELAARRRAYASDINLVQQALAVDNLARAQALLYRQRPKPGEKDLRDWEWRYLWQFCQSDALFAFASKEDTWMRSLAVSSDGTWLAVGEGRYGGLSVWNLTTKEEIRVPAGQGMVKVTFSPREPLLAISGEGENARSSRVWLWDLTTRTTLREIDPGFPVTGLFFSEDGQTLVTSTASLQNEICFWRVVDGTKLAHFPAGPTGGDNLGSKFALSRDLSQAAYVSLDGEIHLLDLATGKERWSARGADELVLALTFSPDGKVLASGAGYTESDIRLWNTATGTELGRLEGSRRAVVQLVFWPDGKTLASTGGDRTIRIWDVAERRLVRTLRGHTRMVSGLVLLPDKRRLVSGSADGTVMFWDGTVDPVSSGDARISGGPAAWRFSEEGDGIIALEESGRLIERRGKGFRDKKTLLEIGGVERAIIAGDCGLLAAVRAGRIQVWDWNRRVLAREFVGDDAEEFFPVRFLGKGKTLLIHRRRAANAYWLEEWDVATGRRVRDWTLPANGFPPEISPDEKYFVSFAHEGRFVRSSSGLNGGEALIRTELSTGHKTTLTARTREMRRSSFSADSALFAAPSNDGFVDVVDVATWRRVAAPSGGIMAGMHSAAFSLDGQRLMTGTSGNEAVILWDMNTYERLLTLPAASSVINAVAFSPDGNFIVGRSAAGATAGMGRANDALYVWRAPSLREIEAKEAQKAR